MTQSTVDHELFENEYEHSAVPQNKRKSLLSVTSIWVGFPMIITGAVTGATLVHELGFAHGIMANVIGNVLLFAYVGLLSMLGARDGNNFSLQATRTFGRKGYMISSALLSTLVVGWFAVQTGLTGVSMNAAFHVSTVLIVVLAGIFYIVLTLLGIKALSIIGMISAPLFLVLGVYSAVEAVGNGHAVVSYAGNSDSPMAFWVAVTLVFALFADSGTMTADFTRWAKNRKHAVIATFAAFPVANLIAMLIGGVVAASTLTGSGDVFGVIVGKGGILTWIAVVFLFINLGSVCSHCLYNGAVGWSHITGTKMRTMTIILGVIGIAAAAFGIWNYFINWLNLLGVIVPPIGTIILMDQLDTRKSSTAIDADIRIQPFLAWGIGSAAALVVNYQFPGMSTAITGMIVSTAAYWLVSKRTSAVASQSVTARR